MQVINQEKVKWGYVIRQTLLFMILPPMIGLPYVISKIWKKANATVSDYYAYFGAMATYFGSINATKVPGGDQANYYVAFMNVPTQGFIGSLKNIYGIAASEGHGAENISGEFMNGVFNYIGYYLTLGYYPLFEFLLTIAMFFFIYLAIHRFCKTLENPHIPTVCGVLILSYFYIFFQFTLQIQKQFLAQCIMMYVIGCYAETGKMTKGLWATAIVAVFTHASTALFIPFLYYKPMWGRMNRNAMILFGALFVAGIFYGPRMASEVSVDDMGVAGYGIDRFARSEENNDDAGSIPFAQLLVVVGPIAWICFKKLWYERKRYLSPTNAFVLNIALLLILTVAAMQRQPTAQYRFFMMLYAFVPFVMPFMSNGIRMRDNILKGVSIFMIGWFYFQFEKIIWQYASEMRILMSPPLALIGSGFDGFQWVF